MKKLVREECLNEEEQMQIEENEAECESEEPEVQEDDTEKETDVPKLENKPVDNSKKKSWREKLYGEKTPEPVDNLRIVFTAEAYLKMFMLIQSHKCEVAWDGTVERLADDLFFIKDILVYPQKTTGVTVNELSMESYIAWKDALDDDTYNSLKFQGHSHVYMGTTPSPTDIEHQKNYATQLKGEQFFIFLITNKTNDMNFTVYDAKTRATYCNDHISYGIVVNDGNRVITLTDWIDKYKEFVKEK